MSYAQFWGNRLILMMKPPSYLAMLMAAEPRADARAADRLHMTMLLLGTAQAMLVEHAIAALDALMVTPFRVAFDRIHCSGRTVALRGSEAMRGAIRAQAEIRQALIQHGIALPPYAFHPHITLAYRPDHRGTEAIDPISWRVEDIRLIESVTGRGRHIEHGRWRLPEGAPA